MIAHMSKLKFYRHMRNFSPVTSLISSPIVCRIAMLQLLQERPELELGLPAKLLVILISC
jgi:hypothetical protein